ncbi:hypothetical protein OsI_13069 [Oryza sativa Indica Group]|uniref:Uncharacterized protein n=1 Tax=Oryza sativa subsp. indica TaxID=39946 RepID=B8APL7_ORYSI|nr:hypothetical protein OsI_13069 [Oryza sativa Indica Group]
MKCKVRRGCSSLPRSTPPPIPHSPLAQVGAKGEVRQSASQPPRPLHGRGDTCARLQRSMPPDTIRARSLRQNFCRRRDAWLIGSFSLRCNPFICQESSL